MPVPLRFERTIIEAGANRRASLDYRNQKGLTITLVAVGIIIALSSLAGIFFTHHRAMVFPIVFTITLIGGMAVAFRPLFYDRTPYHTTAFRDRLDCRCRPYQEPHAWVRFLKMYDFVKLSKYGLIDARFASEIEAFRLRVHKQPPAVIRNEMKAWNRGEWTQLTS